MGKKTTTYWMKAIIRILNDLGIEASKRDGAKGLAIKAGAPTNITKPGIKLFLKDYVKSKRSKIYKIPVDRDYTRGNVPKDPNLLKNFYDTPAWKKLRYKALLKYGRICMCCQSIEGPFHVDHVKPRSKYPELALTLSNLQILCGDCNLGKGAWDETDFRTG